jgi:hypothetical protein
LGCTRGHRMALPPRCRGLRRGGSGYGRAPAAPRCPTCGRAAALPAGPLAVGPPSRPHAADVDQAGDVGECRRPHIGVRTRSTFRLPLPSWYVERAVSEETAAQIRGLRPWVTNEYEHNGLLRRPRSHPGSPHRPGSRPRLDAVSATAGIVRISRGLSTVIRAICASSRPARRSSASKVKARS